MSYRDDLEAAQQRAEAAERRADQLELQLARTRGEELVHAPIVAIPAKFSVAETAESLVVRWRWFMPKDWFLILFTIVWDAALAAWATAPGLGWGTVLFASLHIAAGVVLTYTTLARILNSTTVTASHGQVHVRHAPIPWPGTGSVAGGDLTQLFCREESHGGGSRRQPFIDYDVCAVLASGGELPLVEGLEEQGQARYLEHAFERHLGIRDRPVAGELPAARP